MNKKSKFWIILVIVILIVISIFVFFNEKGKTSKDAYFVYNDSGTFMYSNGKWDNFSKEENTIFDNKFKVYIDRESKGKFEMRYVNDRWYFFDSNMDSEDFSGDIFAYYSKNNISVAENKVEEIDSNDISYINKALKKEKITVNESTAYRIGEKTNYDVDSDGKEETIYAVSTADILEDLDDSFSTIFYVKNNKVYTLLLDTYTNNSDSVILYSINNLFSFENENKYYLSINQFSDMSNENDGTILYGLDLTNKYKLEISSNEKTSKVKNNSSLNLWWIILPVILIALGAYAFYKKMQEKDID